MRAPGAAVARTADCARPAWIVFPQYTAGAATTLEPMDEATLFMEVARNAFNYSILAQPGFHALGRLCDQVQGYRFSYSQLDEALALMSRLTPRS